MANLAKEAIQVVVAALDDNSVSGARKMHIVQSLIEYFDGNGWTGQNEAMAEFLDDPWVSEAFKRADHIYVEVKKNAGPNAEHGGTEPGRGPIVRGRPSKR